MAKSATGRRAASPLGLHHHRPLVGADGRNSTLAIRTDITARKAAEERLEEAVASDGEILETIPLPVYIKGPDTAIYALNRAFEAFFQIRREDYLGRATTCSRRSCP